jgi:hypothetical protein
VKSLTIKQANNGFVVTDGEGSVRIAANLADLAQHLVATFTDRDVWCARVVYSLDGEWRDADTGFRANP